MNFSHENLKVYQRTLTFNAKVCTWTGQWNRKHAISDQLSRAAESMLENIAMASAAFSAMKTSEWKVLLERVSAMTAAMIRSTRK